MPAAERSRAAVAAPSIGVAIACLAFLVVRPPVGDLWAARARASAASAGVGLHYWFAWFGGVVPGHYSVLEPSLLDLAGAEMLGIAATMLVAPLTWVLVRRTPHAIAATGLAGAGATLNLWSGRIPFAQGSVLALVALVGVLTLERRVAGTSLGVCAGVLSVLVSPVSGVFVGLALTAVALHDRARRTSAVVTVAATGATALGIGLYFGSPGPEGFPILQAITCLIALLVMLTARPAPAVRTTLIASAVVLAAVVFIPNGLGSNFERFIWLCLPPAVLTTTDVQWRRASAAALVPLAFAVAGTSKDLWIAHQSHSRADYYTGLIQHLDRLPGVDQYRVETVPDGAHAAATVLLGHAMLARGYETQTDNAQNAVLLHTGLTAVGYRNWLDRYAVGYVLLDRAGLDGPEDALVRHHTPPYLRASWSDAHFVLYAVAQATPIVSRPARITDADQSNLEITVPTATAVAVRVHWSPSLQAVENGQLLRVHRTAAGWLTIDATEPGRIRLSAR